MMGKTEFQGLIPPWPSLLLLVFLLCPDEIDIFDGLATIQTHQVPLQVTLSPAVDPTIRDAQPRGLLWSVVAVSRSRD